MGTKEVDLVTEAIAGTEKEIMDAAWKGDDAIDDGDDSGDRSLEEMGEGLEGRAADEDTDADGADDSAADAAPARDPKTGQFAAKKDGDEGAADAGDQDEQQGQQAQQRSQDDDADQHRIPRSALIAERERRQAAETERDTFRQEASQQIQALNQRLDMVLQALTTRQAPQLAAREEPKQDEEPVDLFQNPDAFISRALEKALSPIVQQIQGVRAESIETRHELSMRSAHIRHGEEVFNAAFNAFQKLDRNNPDDFAAGRRIAISRDPGEAMVKWFTDNRVLREVGSDPAAYRSRIEKETRDALLADPEFKKQIMSSLREEAASGNGGRPRNVVKLPPSANGARGGSVANNANPSLYDNSDQSVFESAWEG